VGLSCPWRLELRSEDNVTRMLAVRMQYVEARGEMKKRVGR